MMLNFNSILVIISDNHQKQTKEHSTRRSLPATTSWDPSVVDPQNVVILRGVLEAQRASVHLDDLLRGKAVEAVHVQIPIFTSEVVATDPLQELPTPKTSYICGAPKTHARNSDYSNPTLESTQYRL